jgi:hypothetical protein
MAVRSLGWLGVWTPAADAMNAFYRDVLRRARSSVVQGGEERGDVAGHQVGLFG